MANVWLMYTLLVLHVCMTLLLLQWRTLRDDIGIIGDIIGDIDNIGVTLRFALFTTCFYLTDLSVCDCSYVNNLCISMLA